MDLSNYATKKELDLATGVDTCDLATKNCFTVFKAEVDKLNINKLVNASTSLNNLKIKVDGPDVSKLKTVFVDLRKLNDVVHNQVIKNTKLNL